MESTINKSKLSETDIITKFILPAIKGAGWDDMSQIRQEVKLRDGKVIVRGQAAARKKVKSADIVLYHKPSMPLAVVEAKANKHEVGKGMQQGLDYASLLEVPFIFASNGDGFIFHDKTILLNSKQKFDLKIFQHPSNYGTSTAFGKATKPSTFQSLLKTIMMTEAESLPVTISYKR